MAPGQTVGKTLEELQQAGWTEVETAQAAPVEGYWEKNGDRITQSEVSAGTRMPRGGGWTWHPPPGAQQSNAIVGGLPDIPFIAPGGEIGPGTLLAGGLAGRSVLGAMSGAAGLVGKLGAGGRAIAPYVAGEATQEGLRSLGAPPWVSYPAGLAVGGATARGLSVAEAPMPRPPVTGRGVPAAPYRDISVPVRPSQLTQEQLAERMFYPTGTAAPS